LSADDGVGMSALAERMIQFMTKAVREAKAYTSWTAQDAEYEQAVDHFVHCALDPQISAVFLRDFQQVCAPVFVAGALNGLTQTLLKIAAPGIPDIYQGTEFWDFSLVDPDNRRPVEFNERIQTMEQLSERDARALVADWGSGAIKLRVMKTGLEARDGMAELFAKGTYLPLSAKGACARHVVAFARCLGTQAILAIAPRLPLRLLRGLATPLIPAEVWGDAGITLPDELAGRGWRNLFDGTDHPADGGLQLRNVLRSFPVALLASIRTNLER
jgi:(1->4)-alpha-D-glucan 1-alpha-D-glucosylmutase